MSAFNNPTTQPLPNPAQERGTQESVVQFWMNYWQNYHLGFYTATNRLAGGTGLDGDNIANRAVSGKHLSANFVRAAQPSSNINFGASPVQLFTLSINIPVVDADVILDFKAEVETTLVNNNLFLTKIERSQNGTTWTSITNDLDTVFVNSGGGAFRYKKLSISRFVDIIPTTGIWFYRAVVSHDRNDIAVPVGLNASTIRLSDPQASWLTAEWRNKRQP